jgi:hypothetical protein
LRNKKYCFQNKQYSKEDYEKILAQHKLETFSGSQKAYEEFENFLLLQPRRFAHLYNCVDSTGTNLVDCKNAKNLFHLRRSENCRYLENGDTGEENGRTWFGVPFLVEPKSNAKLEFQYRLPATVSQSIAAVLQRAGVHLPGQLLCSDRLAVS